MCLGIPGRVVALSEAGATIAFKGAERIVRLDLLEDPVAPGDFVLCHVGFALRRLPPDEAAEMLALFDTLLAWNERAGSG